MPTTRGARLRDRLDRGVDLVRVRGVAGSAVVRESGFVLVHADSGGVRG